MKNQNKYLLPDKSFWMMLTPEQRETLNSKYTIVCPPILFTEIARHGLKPHDALRNLENIVAVPHWFDQVKMDLLTEESSKPLHFGSASAMKSIRESSEEELEAIKNVSNEAIQALIEAEDYYKSLDSIINPVTQKLIDAVKNDENLSEEEWQDMLKQVLGKPQVSHPEIERVLKRLDAGDFPQERKKDLKPFIEKLCKTYNANSLENACIFATNLLNHDPSDRFAAHESLKRLCILLRSILTPEEHTQIFNRFLKEDMPPMSRFAPHALSIMIWHLTIQLYIRETPKNAAPPIGALRDAAYLPYVFYNNVIFISSDNWHKRFIGEVPLFKSVCKRFKFIPHKNKSEEEYKKGLRSIGIKV